VLAREVAVKGAPGEVRARFRHGPAFADEARPPGHPIGQSVAQYRLTKLTALGSSKKKWL
jgi:hypothetical protein